MLLLPLCLRLRAGLALSGLEIHRATSPLFDRGPERFDRALRIGDGVEQGSPIATSEPDECGNARLLAVGAKPQEHFRLPPRDAQELGELAFGGQFYAAIQ